MPVVTSIDLATGGVVINWIAPHDGSSTITEYLVEIANADKSAFFEDTVACGGADPSLTQCLIPMTSLTEHPFYLLFNELIYARVSAKNIYGQNTPSVLNSAGAQVR